MLLAGMMLIVGIAGRTGLFEYVAIHAVKLARARPAAILALLAVITAVFSAFLDNVTTVLLVAPVTLADHPPARSGPLALPLRGDHGLERGWHRHPRRRPAEHHDRLGRRLHLQRLPLQPRPRRRDHRPGARRHRPPGLGPPPPGLGRGPGTGPGHGRTEVDHQSPPPSPRPHGAGRRRRRLHHRPHHPARSRHDRDVRGRGAVAARRPRPHRRRAEPPRALQLRRSGVDHALLLHRTVRDGGGGQQDGTPGHPGGEASCGDRGGSRR